MLDVICNGGAWYSSPARSSGLFLVVLFQRFFSMWSGALRSPIVEVPNFVSIKGLASPQERWWLWLPEHALVLVVVWLPHLGRSLCVA